MGSSLCLTHVRIHAGTRTLIDAFDLTIAPGECVAVLGPQGSGKSALLAWIAGSLAPGLKARGRASIDGEDILALAPAKRGVGLMFDDDLLFPQMTVAGNLLFALVPTLRGRTARYTAVERTLREIGMDGCSELYPEALSNAERVKVSLMRALLAQPRVLLLDEPFGRFDAAQADDVRRFTFAQLRRFGVAALHATRAPADAEASGGRVVMLAPAEAGASGVPDEQTRAPRRRMRVA